MHWSSAVALSKGEKSLTLTMIVAIGVRDVATPNNALILENESVMKLGAIVDDRVKSVAFTTVELTNTSLLSVTEQVRVDARSNDVFADIVRRN